MIFGNYKDNFSFEVIASMADFNSPMNQDLLKLYEKFMEKYYQMPKDLRDENALPYLLAASRNYEKADIKIMICGKESDDWGHARNEFENKEPAAKDLMVLYDFWINGNGGTEKDNGGYGPLMKFYAEDFKYYFEDHAKDEDEKLKHHLTNLGKTIGCIASNIFKISHRGTGYDETLNKPFTDLFSSEIDILNPDIIIATVYRKDKKSYREMIDKKFNLKTVEYTFYANERYEKIPINDNKILYLTRHPQGMSGTLKKDIWNDVREAISDIIEKS